MSSPILTWTRGVVREVLPNGLTVLVQRDSAAPVAAVVTHVKAGFFDEPDRWQGISHVLEHMFFKGTPTRGVGQIARETKAAGGYLNAGTSYDHTSYYVVLPATRLAEAVAIQADALMHATVDADELARELQVIIQEAKRKLDTPDAVTQETLNEVMFDRHRIRRWRIGYEPQLAGFTREDVVGYYHSRYVPDRTIVTIAGDVDVDEALQLARRTYGGWRTGPATVDRSPEEPPHREVRARSLSGDVTQAELALGWRGVPPLDPRAIPLELAAAVLGAGRGSRLYRAIREPGLATSVSAWHYAPTELGVFSIDATCPAERVAEVVERVAEEVRSLTRHGPSPSELERARTLLLARWSRGMEEMDGRASALATAEAIGDYHLLDREFAELATSTGEQVRQAAADILDPGAVSAVVYYPREAAAGFGAEQLKAAFGRPAGGVGLAAPAVSGWSPRKVGSGGAPGSSQARTEFEVSHLALPGFDLLVRRKPGIPLTSLGVYLPRTRFDPLGKAGAGALAVRSCVRGAGPLDAGALALAFEGLGGSISTSVTLDWLGFGTSVLSQNMRQAAELLSLVLTDPRYEAAHVNAEREVLVEEARHVADDMFRYPIQLVLRSAFGDQGYGIPASGLPGDLAALTLDDVRSVHRNELMEPRGIVVAVGDLETGRMLDDLSGVFGALPARPSATLEGRIGWLPGGTAIVREEARQKAQTAIALAFPGPGRRDANRHAADVWCAVASGLGGRLFEALRDRRSLAYTVLLTSWQKARGGAFIAYIATAPEREEEARREMLSELSRFAEEPVTSEELDQARNYLAGQAAVQRQTSADLAGEILEAWLAGEGLSDLDDPGARYLAVSRAEVQAAATRALQGGEARAEGVVRGVSPASG
ncbi:MAG: insulinase family protein [Gemmatimonadota bacterium]|nr:insulinase family protein [Gemmatimonadota bacterium]MDH5282293.1 insulinase family protein [Gemmatimonadota bacterium]